MIFIMGVQFNEGKEHQYIGYPVMDVLQMVGKARRPLEYENSRCVLMYQQTYFYKFLSVAGRYQAAQWWVAVAVLLKYVAPIANSQVLL